MELTLTTSPDAVMLDLKKRLTAKLKEEAEGTTLVSDGTRTFHGATDCTNFESRLATSSLYTKKVTLGELARGAVGQCAHCAYRAVDEREVYGYYILEKICNLYFSEDEVSSAKSTDSVFKHFTGATSRTTATLAAWGRLGYSSEEKYQVDYVVSAATQKAWLTCVVEEVPAEYRSDSDIVYGVGAGGSPELQRLSRSNVEVVAESAYGRLYKGTLQAFREEGYYFYELLPNFTHTKKVAVEATLFALLSDGMDGIDALNTALSLET